MLLFLLSPTLKELRLMAKIQAKENTKVSKLCFFERLPLSAKNKS